MLFLSTIIYFLMMVYLYVRFVKKLNFSPAYRQIFFYLLVLVGLLAISYMPVRKLDLINATLLEFFAFSVGAVFIFVAITFFYEFARIFLRNRRDLIVADILVVVIALLLIGYGFFEAVREPKIVEIEFESKKLHRDLKLAQLTDLHLGNSIFLDKNFAREVAKRISKEQVDLVAITGDLIDAPLAKVKDALQEIAKIQSTYGIYYVLGNHEYLYEVGDLIDYLKTLGIVVLENSNKQVVDNIYAAGIYDLFGKRKGIYLPDVDAALSGVDENSFTIFMTHQPKAVDLMDNHKPDLIIAGHTHCGQIFPFGLIAKIDQPFVVGLHKEKNLYVSCGAGFWGPPIRLFAPSELTIIHLKQTKER